MMHVQTIVPPLQWISLFQLGLILQKPISDNCYGIKEKIFSKSKPLIRQVACKRIICILFKTPNAITILQFMLQKVIIALFFLPPNFLI